MFVVYIIKSKKTNKHYIGYTENLSRRIKKHNSGSNRSTKSGRPWIVIYTEKYFEKADAWKREKEIKQYKGGIKFKKLIGGVG